MSLYYLSPRPHSKHSNVQLQILSMCRLQHVAMPSRLTVVLVSLLLSTPAVIFWLWLLILPTRYEVVCPKDCRCQAEGYIVNCSDSGINSIPSNPPTHVRLLELDGNNITYFENGTFVSRGLVELEILNANFCKLRKIELGAFNGLTNLMLLSIVGNKISEIIPGTFEKMSRLELLGLDHNVIQHLENYVFSGLVNLKVIGLQGNKLQYLHPDTFLGLSKLPSLQIPNDFSITNSLILQRLAISDCNAPSVLVETFSNASALKVLDLSYNNLRSVDINILKLLPNLSALYLYGNPLHCDCQLQEVWRWSQDHNIQTAYNGIAPKCYTPSEVKRIWWGVLETGQCLQGKIQYYGDYKNTSYSCTPIKDMDTLAEIEIETLQAKKFSSSLKQYELPVSAIFLIFGTTGNIIIIMIITCNKDMRTVPNMNILNLAISDIIYLTVLFSEICANRIHVLRLGGYILCAYFSFFRRLSVGLTAYSIAVLSVQRYRVTVYPLHVCFSSKPTWLATGATICGVWIVAALFAIPAARSKYLCDKSVFLWRTKYYQRVAIFQLLVSCVLPLCVIAFSYIMTARHLLKSSSPISEETQISRLNTRRTSAKVVLGLTVVSLISYVPYHICDTCLFSSINVDNSFVKLIEEEFWVYTFAGISSILKLFLSINSCLNPVALCCTSLAFRRQFKRYLTCCCKERSSPTDFELEGRH